MSAIFANPRRQIYHIIKVDGGLVEQQRAADYVVCRPGVGNLVVELKGKDVGVACGQIEATLSIMNGCKDNRFPVAGLIVCTRVPCFDTKVQGLKSYFAKKYKSRLTVCSSKNKFDFEKLF
ncbi:hypothetical protein ACPPVV_10805 [Rhodanobacter sp. Col0626]|uniref:hypothetical protein n=1 Tax=Rhodanobacter sp. Col0626 TaxID=3415679 RepID=UPI003CF1784C